MNYKVFIHVFFEKSRYMIFYSLAITTFWSALFLDINFVMYRAYYEDKMPDIEIFGKGTDFVNGDLLYEDLDPEIYHVFGENIKTYGVIARNLYTFSDAYYHVSYRIYCADDEFINELQIYLKKGGLPEEGKREAVIGSRVAQFFDLKVGDVVELPVIVEDQSDSANHSYRVSGILKDDASFFSDGLYISKDTYQQMGNEANDTILYVYANNKKLYQEAIDCLQGLTSMDEYGGMINHYEHKTSLQKSIGNAVWLTIPFSAIVLTVLFLSLMKYTGRKIGLMKALGISDRNLMKFLIKGFGVYNAVAMLLSYMDLGLISVIEEIPVPVSVRLYCVYSFAVTFVVTIIILFVLCKKIPPRLAMN